MELNLQMEGGSEQATSSDDGQFVVALRKMVEKEIEVRMIRTVEKVIVPIMEDLTRKVVKEEIQSAQKKFFSGGSRSPENETTFAEERSLRLKFLDEVSLTVLTGKVIEGIGKTPIRVALEDKITGQVVERGPESSSKVEILVLEVKDGDNEDTWNGENFNNRIIREGNKTKPHFTKSKYIDLKEGIGTLCDTKLGHDSSYSKKYKCRLGARMVETFSGIKVQEAWTKPFIVSDSRNKLYKKRYPPLLNDQVWRLDNIGKGGRPCERLEKEGIKEVKDFLFLNNTNPQKLKQIVCSGAKMNATLKHAQTCKIDDERMYLYYPLSEPRMGVVFDVVGQLKGAIHDSHYVPESDMSEAEQDSARNLLLSAFENRKDIKNFDDENAVRAEYPDTYCYPSSESISQCDPTEPGTSSQVVRSAIGTFGVPTRSPSPTFFDINLCEFLASCGKNNISEPIRAEPHSRTACRIQLFVAASLIRWMVRARNQSMGARNQFMALGAIQDSKRQRLI